MIQPVTIPANLPRARRIRLLENLLAIWRWKRAMQAKEANP